VHVHDHLTLEVLQVLTDSIRGTKLWKRHQAVVLAIQGRSAKEIAQALSCSQRAAQKWVTRYNQLGPDALQEQRRSGRPLRFAGPEVARFVRRIEAGPTPEEGRSTFYGHDYQRILEDEFGVVLSLQAVYDLLHRLGFSSLMPRPQHKDADEELQAIFKEVVADQIQAIAEAHPERKVEVFFEDEARMGQQGTLCRVWARTGSRPRGVRQTQYGYLYVLTATCAATGMACGLISPVLNVGVVNIFLEQLSRELAAGVHAVLIWDGAGYHTSPMPVVPSNISLVQLPPYSPELNPVENLWHYLRSHYWSLQVYANYEAMEEAVMTSWREVCLSTEVIRSVCSTPYVDDKICD
jgi:transposase